MKLFKEIKVFKDIYEHSNQIRLTDLFNVGKNCVVFWANIIIVKFANLNIRFSDLG